MCGTRHAVASPGESVGNVSHTGATEITKALSTSSITIRSWTGTDLTRST